MICIALLRLLVPTIEPGERSFNLRLPRLTKTSLGFARFGIDATMRSLDKQGALEMAQGWRAAVQEWNSRL